MKITCSTSSFNSVNLILGLIGEFPFGWRSLFDGLSRSTFDWISATIKSKHTVHNKSDEIITQLTNIFAIFHSQYYYRYVRIHTIVGSVKLWSIAKSLCWNIKKSISTLKMSWKSRLQTGLLGKEGKYLCSSFWVSVCDKTLINYMSFISWIKTDRWNGIQIQIRKSHFNWSNLRFQMTGDLIGWHLIWIHNNKNLAHAFLSLKYFTIHSRLECAFIV